jgi:hypothetical protein
MPDNNKKAIYYPRKEGDVVVFYDNAEGKIVDSYGIKYGIDPALIAKITAHKTKIPNLISVANVDRQTAQKSKVLKDEELQAGKTDLLTAFKFIEASPLFEEADAEDLGMRITTQPIDFKTIKPIVSEITMLDYKIIFDWVKGRLDGVLIEGSFDGNSWEKLDKDTKSPWEDTRKNKVNLVPETRYYRFIYLKNDVPVGLFTDAIKIVCAIY